MMPWHDTSEIAPAIIKHEYEIEHAVISEYQWRTPEEWNGIDLMAFALLSFYDIARQQISSLYRTPLKRYHGHYAFMKINYK